MRRLAQPQLARRAGLAGHAAAAGRATDRIHAGAASAIGAGLTGIRLSPVTPANDVVDADRADFADNVRKLGEITGQAGIDGEANQ